jgi:hypothetical protein
MNNRSVPTSTILAHLCYRDLAETCTWLIRVFGFTEYYRYGQPLSGIQLYLGDAHIMISGPREGRFEPPGKRAIGTTPHPAKSEAPIATAAAHTAATKSLFFIVSN